MELLGEMLVAMFLLLIVLAALLITSLTSVSRLSLKEKKVRSDMRQIKGQIEQEDF